MKTLLFSFSFLLSFNLFSQNQELSPYQKSTMNTQRFARPVNTGSNHTLLILGSAWDCVLEIGDEIAVYDTQNNMVSSVAWRPEQQGHSGLAIFGDDETTSEKEGMKKDEPFKIILFDKSEDKLFNLQINKYERGNNIYSKDGVTVIGSISVKSPINAEIELFQNVPNPAQEKTIISFFIPKSGKIKLYLTDSLGKEIQVISEQSYIKGLHNIEFNSKDIDSGVYIYTLEMNKSKLSKHLSIIK